LGHPHPRIRATSPLKGEVIKNGRTNAPANRS
jgi:hypothetical protein